MKHPLKRLLTSLLLLSMLLGLMAPVWAEDSQIPVETGTEVYCNPLYPEAEAEAAAEAAAENEASQEALLAPDISRAKFVSVQEAEKQLRDYMKNRTQKFVLYISSPYGKPDMKGTIIPAAYSEELATGVNTGDYLQWSWSYSNWTYYTYSGGRYVFEMDLIYYTTAAQEQQFLKTLSAVVDELDLWRVSDYQKYCGIYDYITDHVDYAYEELDRGDRSIYSAYSALLSGRAVCQGYATLLYAMCRSMGLPVRIITGDNHAWNIVGINGVYYNMDATWDGQTGQSYRRYFLKGSGNFGEHNASSEYLSASFRRAYPVSGWDYAPTYQDSLPVSPFRDVPVNSYYYDAIQVVADRGLFNGTSSYTFEPEGTMNRAMLVTVLWRMAGKQAAGTQSGFRDVPSNAYYAEAVTWAKSRGIAAGISATEFGPNQKLTREQAAVFLYRYASAMGYRVNAFNNLAAYQDISKAGSYAIPALRWAVGAGILNGVSSTSLDPRGSATRGQMAVMMTRFLNYYKI